MNYNLPNLTKNEAKALKVMEIYLNLLKKYVPDDPLNRKIVKKPPRQTSIFKYCYKLVTERDLQISDYYNFVLSQFHIIKSQRFTKTTDKKIIDLLGVDNCERTATISYVTLPSDKAWNRWLVWKNYYKKHEKSLEVKSSEEVGINVHKNVIKKLEESKKYLEQKGIDLVNKEKILQAVALGFVSGYYLYHPKIFNQIKDLNLLDKFAIDVKFFEKGITEEVRKWFIENTLT